MSVLDQRRWCDDLVAFPASVFDRITNMTSICLSQSDKLLIRYQIYKQKYLNVLKNSKYIIWLKKIKLQKKMCGFLPFFVGWFWMYSINNAIHKLQWDIITKIWSHADTSSGFRSKEQEDGSFNRSCYYVRLAKANESKTSFALWPFRFLEFL